MYASVLVAVTNPYHPPTSSDAPLDVLLITVGLVILILLVAVPAHLARAREGRRLSGELPAPPTQSEASAASPR